MTQWSLYAVFPREKSRAFLIMLLHAILTVFRVGEREFGPEKVSRKNFTKLIKGVTQIINQTSETVQDVD